MNRKQQKIPTLEELNQRLKALEKMNVEKTLETLDKGSPKLNWAYVLLAMAGIFIMLWLLFTLVPGEDVTETVPSSSQSQIESLQKQVETLEQRVDELERQ